MRLKRLTMLAIGLAILAQMAQADWMPTKRLTWTSGWSEYPAVATDPFGIIHLVWLDDTPGNYEIYYKKSANGGDTWTGAKRLTWNPAVPKSQPKIAADSSGHLHVVWHDSALGNAEIYYRRSTDGGASWTAGLAISGTSGESYLGNIVVDSSDNLVVAWRDDTAHGIYCTKSTNGGVSWLPSQRITWLSGWSNFPCLATGPSGSLHVVWRNDTSGNQEIYHTKSTDGGASWTVAKRITWTSGSSDRPSLAVDPSGNLQLVWQDDTPGNVEIYYRKSADGGATWPTVRRLTWTPSWTDRPSIAADSWGNLHVVWEDQTDGWEIYYKKSNDGGASWTPNKRITWGNRDCVWPGVAVDDYNYVHVVWTYGCPAYPGEIYYRYYEVVY